MSCSSLTMFNEITGELLRCGNRVRFRAVGASMQPTIEDGELITVAPVEPAAVKRGDILLYRGERGLIAHRLESLRKSAKGEDVRRSEEHTSELQSPCNLVCRLLLEKKKKKE